MSSITLTQTDGDDGYDKAVQKRGEGGGADGSEGRRRLFFFCGYPIWLQTNDDPVVAL